MLQLKDLRMTRWVPTEPITGTVTFSGDHGEVKLILTEEHCSRILEVVAAALVEMAQEQAAALTTKIIEHANTLPGLS